MARATTERRTLVPDDFTPNEATYQWALKNGWSDPDAEVEAFKDYHLAHGTLMFDWNAAFRNWLRNAERYGKRQTQKEGELSERTKKILRRGL